MGQPKKEDLLNYSYSILGSYWPKILAKLNLKKVDFEIPRIFFTTKISHFTRYHVDDEIGISLKVVRQAYAKKKKVNNGLEYSCESVLKDDLIHEGIHYIQNYFYDVTEKVHDPISEGLACLLSNELLLKEKKDRSFVVKHIADSLAKFGCVSLEEVVSDEILKLRSEEKDYIKKVLSDHTYYPLVRMEHAEGFVRVCKLKRFYPSYKHFLKPQNFTKI